MELLSPANQSVVRIYAHEGAVANVALQEQDQPPAKKRCMGRPNIEATGAGSSSQIPRLQPDPPAIPPLKLRRFNNNRSVVTPSFSPSDHSGLAPMEAEPSTSPPESSRPVAVVRPVTVQSIIPNTAIRYKVVMDHFIPDHQNQLLDLFDSQLYPLEIVEAATRLLEICQSRGIQVKPTLFDMLEFHTIDQNHQDLLTFFEKVAVFFSAVKTDIIKDTSCLTSMLNTSGPGNRRLIRNFITQPDESVKTVAGSQYLKQLSSMFNAKGLPKKEDVEAFVGWDFWKVDGQFSLELLRAVSSMFNAKGLPKKEDVEAFVGWDCWMVDGQFRLELLRTFSSMFNGKGLPKKEDVEAFVGWDCWMVDGQFRLELLRTFSSMSNGKGLPKKEDVEAFVGLDCWKVDGQFSLELLRPCSTLFLHGKGLPEKEDVGWLPKDEDKKYLKLASRIFVNSGLPDTSVLNQYERQLTNRLSTKAGGTNITNEDDVKSIALFSAGPAKWKLNIKDFEGYIEGHKKSERSSLKPLQVILFNHGGKGVRCWLEMYKKNPTRKQAITDALLTPAPLDRARFAFGELPEKQWKDYIQLCGNLSPAPTKEQWQSLESLRETLDKKFKLTEAKRQMMDILWPLNESDRARYGNRMDDLLKMVPTTEALHRIHRKLGVAKMKIFLRSCLEYRDSLSSADKPGEESLTLLLEGLLVAKLPLYDHKDIPGLCFSERTSSADGKSVLIKGQTSDGGGQRLGHFIAAMLDELYAMEYRFQNRQLTIELYDGATLSLPKPEFAITGAGFLIKNWTGQQLGDFLKATEFTETWYQQPHDKHELFTGRLEKRLEQMKDRAGKTPEKGASNPVPFLKPGVIHQLIKNKKPLKPKVWETLAHYASTNQLPVTLCKALQPIIQDSAEGVVPDGVRSCVSTTIQKAEPVTVSIPSPRSVPTTCTLEVPCGKVQRPEVALEGLLQQLQSTSVLEEVDLALLETHRQQMTYEQVRSVTQKISCGCGANILTGWHVALEGKRKALLKKNPLGLELSDIDFHLLVSGDRNQSWREDTMEAFVPDLTEGLFD